MFEGYPDDDVVSVDCSMWITMTVLAQDHLMAQNHVQRGQMHNDSISAAMEDLHVRVI